MSRRFASPEQETPVTPAAADGGLLGLHAALEEMELLSSVAGEARTVVPGEVTQGDSGRLIRISDRIQAVIEDDEPVAAPVKPADSILLLPAESRNGFEILGPACPRNFAEAFRKLRGQLMEERARREVAGRSLSSLAIASPRRGGGRSATARNLAACLAALPETRVLLLDVDVANPSLHRRLRISQSPGLAEAIGLGGPAWLAYARGVPGSGLYVLPLGEARRHGIDALDHVHLPAFLDRARAGFDWIVLDAPAMETADGEAIAGVADGVVMVLRNGREFFDEANAALRRLDASRLVGAILNHAS